MRPLSRSILVPVRTFPSQAFHQKETFAVGACSWIDLLQHICMGIALTANQEPYKGLGESKS